MSGKTLFEGADGYTTPAEIAQETDVENPEASPAVIATGVASFNASLALTNTFGC